MGLLKREERLKLEGWLLQLLNVVGPQSRGRLLVGLPESLGWHLALEGSLANYVWNIVDLAEEDGARLEDGTWPILIILENAIGMAEGLALRTNFQSLRSTLEARARSRPISEDPQSPGDVTWLRVLRQQLNTDLDQVKRLKAILTQDPGWARLNNIARPQSLRDIVLPELRRINVHASIFSILNTQEATDWLDTARAQAAAGVDNLNNCYRWIDTLIGIGDNDPARTDTRGKAFQAASESARKWEELLVHIDGLLGRHAALAGEHSPTTDQARRSGAPGAPSGQPGAPSDRLRRLRDLLLRCDEYFDSNRNLQTLFTDTRLAPWRNNVPEAENRTARVDLLIAYLHDKRNSRGEMALPLLLQVLADRHDPSDARQGELFRLAGEFDPPAA